MGETTTPKIKPGILTTEFWLSFGTVVTGILTALGILTPAEADEFVSALMSVMGGVLTLGTLIVYIVGRINLKRAQMKNGSQTMTLLEGIPDAPSSGGTGQYVE